MMETEEDKADLKEIDDYLMQLTGADKYANTNFGKLMLQMQGL